MSPRAVLIYLMLTVLSACGTAADEDSPLGQSLAVMRGETEEFVPRFTTLLRSETEALQFGFIEQGRSGTALLEHRDGAFEYWLSSDGTHIVLQNGMLHSTRGIGEGLLASELSQPLVLVQGLQSGWSDRFHTYLDGNDRAVTRTYRCRIENIGARVVDLYGTPATTRLMREDCRSLDQEFVNLYWVDPSGRDIIVSRQWAGPVIGAISTRIVPR